ncbi:MAG: heme ABC transporter ATP-binding protein [Rothia sp. (in: high G+C Gram-positive bacteria)]|nr:heme ABC transporter ATP-binding protein [Rothia sp. (in: high G+C Gram-positive bacteria)]
MTAPLLVADSVGYQVNGRQILHDISLEVAPGEVLALIGPNGTGKSTLLSLLAGDTSPSSGQITLGGRPLTDYRPVELARTRAMLLQHTSVAFSYTVQQVVQMGRTPWRGTEQARQNYEIVSAALVETDTERLAGRDVRTLSGGETGRTHLARGFAQRTPLLLLDEPTAALDILHQEQTLTHARAYARQGAAVVVVLHDLDVAASYSDRLVLLAKGRVVAQGRPQQVCTAERLSTVYGHPIEVLTHPVTGRLLVLPARD